jgi:hypothetical protein
MKQLYIILGASGSGRMEVVGDMIESLRADSGQRTALIFHKDEVSPSAAASALRWSVEGGVAVLPQLPADADCAFLFLNGSADPVDQLEALVPLLTATDGEYELARIMTIVNCQLLSANAPLRFWFDACIHFSDVVILHRREGVPNKWVGDFIKHYEKLHLPCLVVQARANGRLANPAEILVPEARRMSLAFELLDVDDLPKDPLPDLDGVEITDETGAPLDIDELVEDDGVQDDPLPMEEYFERDAAGRRKKALPDIRPFLAK